MSQSNISQSGFQAPAAQGAAPPDLSVVIVSWNVCELVLDCLEALQAPATAGELRLEVIVVDNASSDGTVEALRGRPGVRVVEAGGNLGYGRANNLGFSLATGRHLLVLNPDTLPQPGCLAALVCCLESHPLVGMASPRLLNADGSVQAAAFRFPTLVMAALDLFPLPRIVPGRLRQRLYASRVNGRYPQEVSATEPFMIDHPLGACMLVRRGVIEEVGGFDPAIHMYSEEVDLAMRLQRSGWERWQVPAARVVHLGGRSTAQIPDRMYVELWRSRLYLYRKYRPLTARIALGVLIAVAQLAAAFGALLGLATRVITPREARRRWRRASAVLRLIAGL
ncbi:MAG: glycosyltransferase family 2 protein [Chloroflexia bacterium]